eukprot:scaffold21580_cov65-Phaeocystis_antarctica.AAC.6
MLPDGRSVDDQHDENVDPRAVNVHLQILPVDRGVHARLEQQLGVDRRQTREERADQYDGHAQTGGERQRLLLDRPLHRVRKQRPRASVADGGGSGGAGVTRVGSSGRGVTHGRTNTIHTVTGGGTHGGSGRRSRVAHFFGVDAAGSDDGLRQGAHKDHEREPLPSRESALEHLAEEQAREDDLGLADDRGGGGVQREQRQEAQVIGARVDRRRHAVGGKFPERPVREEGGPVLRASQQLCRE